ncbi:uncharacterized protein LOC125495053 [Beta vulgaris subsp. vulgaris]|uniref:uncharacterized protein LOC125495053 n=1 Tax=Beta vulgaris subsp. vulgaris TaxID=3555 RepID=UPI00203706B8|nr:uncharacterized protein LOC125495053 [Beta vulgaris subsp. vulgaris]
MPPSSNKEGTKEVFKWSEEETIILCDICLLFIKNNGRSTFYKWKDIQIDVEKKIERDFNNLQTCKNKYDTMRKDWIKWKSLKSSETGLGWDPISGKIDATDEWWQRKIKENPDFKKFRHRGVSLELEKKWEELFGDSYASGENVYVPSMDPIEDLTVEPENSEGEDIESLGADTYLGNSQFTDALLNEDNFFQNFVEQAKGDSTLGNLGSNSQTNVEGKTNGIRGSKKDKKQPTTSPNNVQMKRSRRQSAGSSMLAKEISEMTQCVKLMSQSSSTTNSSMNPSMFTISTAMNIINRMIDDHILEKLSDLWFYATNLIENATKREVFLSMEDDETRLIWLQRLYDNKDN